MDVDRIEHKEEKITLAKKILDNVKNAENIKNVTTISRHNRVNTI